MKTPDEIKKGLECCANGNLACEGRCVYEDDCCFPDCKEELQLDALAYIKQLEAKVPKWISVEKRKPEKGKFVLLQYAKNAQNPTLHARNTMAVGRYEYGMFIVEGCSVKVTHWMPLPEPPAEV